MATTPQAVSARLRKDGFRTVTADAPEGIRVSKSGLPGRVEVSVDIDLPTRQARVVASLEDALSRWYGYEVEHSAEYPTLFYVTKP